MTDMSPLRCQDEPLQLVDRAAGGEEIIIAKAGSREQSRAVSDRKKAPRRQNLLGIT